MKFPFSRIRRSARPFGKMDKPTTRAMAKKEEVKANTLTSDQNAAKSKDKDEINAPIVSQEKGHNMTMGLNYKFTEENDNQCFGFSKAA